MLHIHLTGLGKGGQKRLCQGGKDIGGGIGLQAYVKRKIHGVRPLLHQLLMADFQARGGQFCICYIKDIRTTYQVDIQFIRSLFDFTEGDAAPSGRSIFIGDAQFFEIKNIMEEYNLLLVTLRLNGRDKIVFAGVFHRGYNP